MIKIWLSAVKQVGQLTAVTDFNEVREKENVKYH